MLGDGYNGSSFWSLPQQALVSLEDGRLAELLATREAEALGEGWVTTVWPHQTASRDGRCYAIYRLTADSGSQELFVGWNGNGGGTMRLSTEVDVDSSERVYHDMDGTF